MNREMELIQELTRSYPRRTDQLNAPFQSDVEVIPFRGGFLCASVDTIAEEIEMGLLRDVESLAWLCVTASASDLASAGVRAQSYSCVVGAPQEWINENSEIFRAMAERAARQYNGTLTEYRCYVNAKPILTCTAAGWSRCRPLSRRGLKVGDVLYVSGPVGWGNAVGFANVAMASGCPELVQHLDRDYRPVARVAEAELFSNWAGASLDTSDGLLFSLDLFSYLNHVGFEINYDSTLFHPVALKVAELSRLAPWLFFASQNGEFEVLFSVEQERANSFESMAQRIGFSPLRLGRVVQGSGLFLKIDNRVSKVDTQTIRNLLPESSSAENYVRTMVAFGEKNGLHWSST